MAPPAPIRESMAALQIYCVLYIHERWGENEVRGLLVAGQPAYAGNSVVLAYKLENGGFLDWPASERIRGPELYTYRLSFLDGGG